MVPLWKLGSFACIVRSGNRGRGTQRTVLPTLTDGLQTRLAIAFEAEALAAAVPSSRNRTIGGTPPALPMASRTWLLSAMFVKELRATSRSVPFGSLIISIIRAVPATLWISLRFSSLSASLPRAPQAA